MEQLGKELGLVVDQLWPAYEKAASGAGMAAEAIGTELVLGGWSPRAGRMAATAYARTVGGELTRVQPLVGGLASPGDPLQDRAASFDAPDVLAACRLQAEWLNNMVRKEGGRRTPFGCGPSAAAVVCSGPRLNLAAQCSASRSLKSLNSRGHFWRPFMLAQSHTFAPFALT